MQIKYLPKSVYKIPKETIEIALSICRKNPTYGKDKIAIILQRDFRIKLSVSSVGRIIKDFLQKGLITSAIDE